MRRLVLTIILTLWLAASAQAVGLQIHTAGTLASSCGSSGTETLGQTTGTNGFSTGPAYYHTGYQAVHTGTISSVDLGVQNNGTFQLIIMDASRNTLRTSSSVSVTVPSSGVLNVVNVTFPAVTINAGEYIGYYYSGYTYSLYGSGGGTYYGTSAPPSSLYSGHQMDILVRIVYAGTSNKVTASAGANGTLDATTPSPVCVASSATTSFKFNANSGYYVSGISGCNGTTYANSSSGVTTYTYTTGAINGACSVNATFAVASTSTEIIGETGIGNTPWSANYSFRPNFAAGHTGTISSAVFHPLETGNFTLLIYNSSGTLLRTSNTVAVTTTGLQTVSFPPVAINAGESIGGHHTGTVNCNTGLGGSSWYGGPGTPTHATTPYVVRFDLQATITY